MDELRLAFLVADVSMKGALIEPANFLPSAAETILRREGEGTRLSVRGAGRRM